MGFAAVFQDYTVRGTLPNQTSIFTAELFAISQAIKKIEHHIQVEWVVITDSLSAIEALKSPTTKHPLVQNIQNKIIELLHQNKKIKICKVPSHVGIKGNEEADTNAKSATQIPGLNTTKLNLLDVQGPIKRLSYRLWQDQWNTNTSKLKEIRPTVDKWPEDRHMKRGFQVKLSRLRVGHTRLTHGYLMSREPPPLCGDCNQQLTVKHLLITCPKYQAMRSSKRLPNSIQELLGQNCQIEMLMQYLIEIEIYDRI